MDTAAQLEAELARMDAEWHRKRETFLVRGKDGTLGEPTGANLIPRVVVMIGSVVVMAFLSATSLPAILPYLCLVPFSVATFQLLSGAGKSDAFDRARSAYEGERSAVVRKLERTTNGQ